MQGLVAQLSCQALMPVKQVQEIYPHLWPRTPLDLHACFVVAPTAPLYGPVWQDPLCPHGTAWPTTAFCEQGDLVSVGPLCLCHDLGVRGGRTSSQGMGQLASQHQILGQQQQGK